MTQHIFNALNSVGLLDINNDTHKCYLRSVHSEEFTYSVGCLRASTYPPKHNLASNEASTQTHTRACTHPHKHMLTCTHTHRHTPTNTWQWLTCVVALRPWDIHSLKEDLKSWMSDVNLKCKKDDSPDTHKHFEVTALLQNIAPKLRKRLLLPVTLNNCRSKEAF